MNDYSSGSAVLSEDSWLNLQHEYPLSAKHEFDNTREYDDIRA
ncbi:hypothetical protein AAEY27_04350 [Kosakonia sp. BYX6]|uniref:Uncharacterized protein n=1 Tax=Kosakonia calanthes TaxID=3139408 RepID=A0ABZ3B7F2_9ENTR